MSFFSFFFTVAAAISALHAFAYSQFEEVPKSNDNSWGVVRYILERYFPFENMAFSAGDASGRRFMFEKGRTRMSSELMMASASKFPAALAIARTVAEGHLTFDTLAHEVFPWWTQDPTDRRSRVTLRHLLSFTSGYYANDAGGTVRCMGMEPLISLAYSSEECAREVYGRAPFEFEPGSTWSYNSFHLQIAGAMAAKAANVTIQELLHKNLINALNLTSTSWVGGRNPLLAGSMQTTGDDYDKILRSYMSYDILPETVTSEMERDYLQGHVQIANSSTTLVRLLGHYSMCTYFECFFPKLRDFTPRCNWSKIHVDAGLFGYYPLMDRARGTYMQIVVMEVPHSMTDFYVPTISSMVLRRIIKPFVDRALAGGSGDQVDEFPDMSYHAIKRMESDILNSADVRTMSTDSSEFLTLRWSQPQLYRTDLVV